MKAISFDIGIYNLAYCVLSWDFHDEVDAVERSKNIKIEDWGILCLKNKEAKAKKSIDFIELAHQLVAQLHDKFIGCVFDYVFIENQPVQKNPTMKSLQMMVFTFFLSQRHLSQAPMVVKLVSACNKLKVIHGKEVCTDGVKDLKSKYQQTKKISVLIAKHYMASILPTNDQNTQMASVLTSSKKQDDLSDCFLQAVYMLENIPKLTVI